MSRLSVAVTLGLVVGLASCGSSSKPPAGKTCSLNTDCNNPLACTFGKCHLMCNDTRDCPAGQRCINVTGGKVCQLDEEKRCPASGTCQQPLICAVDLLCHNTCTTAGDCPAMQICASGACAEPLEVGADGKLKAAPDGGLPAGTGGSGGGGGSGTGGTGGSVDAGADAPPSGAIGPCGVPEIEPNDKREQAVPLTAPTMFTSCIGTPEDIDFYELTTPNDGSGGYYTISFTEIAGWTIDLTVYTAFDTGELGNTYATSDGQDLHAYLAAMAGQKYRLQVKGFINVGKAPAKYTMKVTYTKVDDAQEPNNTRDTAKMINLGTPVTAYLFEGVKALPVKATDLADWYKVTAAAGNVTVNVESVPSNLSAEITIVDPTGKTQSGYSPNDGANATATFMNGPAGTYLISVQIGFVRTDYFFGRATTPTDVPDSYTHAYKMTVTQ